jgi:hypothetical protein
MFHQFNIARARQIIDERTRARPQLRCARSRSWRRRWRRIHVQVLGRRPAQVRHA